MLLPQHRDLELWARGNAALQDLHQRDLTTNPLPDNLLTQGRVLAGIIGVPANALLGWHRARWEGDMCLKLDEVGPDILAAVAC